MQEQSIQPNQILSALAANFRPDESVITEARAFLDQAKFSPCFLKSLLQICLEANTEEPLLLAAVCTLKDHIVRYYAKETKKPAQMMMDSESGEILPSGPEYVFPEEDRELLKESIFKLYASLRKNRSLR